ncbi:MAG TPA: type IX secretion system plug protein domain-containing protein [Rhodothermales bacterium]|nr:type IX secretion system plug protein domain-containing protein [Rhodothermales bacterium]
MMGHKVADWRVVLVFVMIVTGVLGCASTKDTANDGSPGLASAPETDPAYVSLTLEPPAPSISTIQLYRDPDETSLPLVVMGTDQALALEFDLVGKDGRPLRIAFRHFNRQWEDDYLQPVEYMSGRVEDELVNYRRSLTSRSSYAHYTYLFPNASIQFKRSGNYVLTVSDPGTGDVMFQAPFLVSEESSDLAYELRAMSMPGASGLWSQPIVYIDPDDQFGRDLFDWGACFVKNTRFDLARCSSRPSLFEAPYASFSLEPRDSFEPDPDFHIVDLSELRRGLDIDGVTYESTPIEVVLAPDQADLGGTAVSFQNGQSTVSGSVIDVGNPDIESEYVHATFRYIPYRSQQADGDVIVTGSFNRWVLDAANRLVWNEAEGWYEGAILIKQGVHAYQYHISGPRPSSSGAFAPESSYTALLYYFDPVIHADRLIAVRSRIAP